MDDDDRSRWIRLIGVTSALLLFVLLVLWFSGYALIQRGPPTPPAPMQ